EPQRGAIERLVPARVAQDSAISHQRPCEPRVRTTHGETVARARRGCPPAPSCAEERNETTGTAEHGGLFDKIDGTITCRVSACGRSPTRPRCPISACLQATRRRSAARS